MAHKPCSVLEPQIDYPHLVPCRPRHHSFEYPEPSEDMSICNKLPTPSGGWKVAICNRITRKDGPTLSGRGRRIGGKYQCLMCDYHGNSLQSLDYHCRKVHLKIKIPCPVAGCETTFVRNHDIRYHLMTNKHCQQELPIDWQTRIYGCAI